MKLTRLNIVACAVLLLGGCSGKPDTPLTSAAQDGDFEQVRRLLASGMSVDETGSYGFTPLIWATREGHVSVIRELLKHGANPELRAGVNGWTPLMHAVHKGQEGAAMALVDGGAAVDATDGKGMTALIMAAGYGYSGIVKGLLKRGANPYSATADGSNALTVAVGGVPDIDRLLSGKHGGSASGQGARPQAATKSVGTRCPAFGPPRKLRRGVAQTGKPCAACYFAVTVTSMRVVPTNLATPTVVRVGRGSLKYCV